MRVAVPLTIGKIQWCERSFAAQRNLDNSIQVNGSRVRRNNRDSDPGVDQADYSREFLHLAHDLRPKACARAQPQYLPIKTYARFARIHDERLIAQISDGDRALLG